MECIAVEVFQVNMFWVMLLCKLMLLLLFGIIQVFARMVLFDFFKLGYIQNVWFVFLKCIMNDWMATQSSFFFFWFLIITVLFYDTGQMACTSKCKIKTITLFHDKQTGRARHTHTQKVHVHTDRQGGIHTHTYTHRPPTPHTPSHPPHTDYLESHWHISFSLSLCRSQDCKEMPSAFWIVPLPSCLLIHWQEIVLGENKLQRIRCRIYFSWLWDYYYNNVLVFLKWLHSLHLCVIDFHSFSSSFFHMILPYYTSISVYASLHVTRGLKSEMHSYHSSDRSIYSKRPVSKTHMVSFAERCLWPCLLLRFF